MASWRSTFLRFALVVLVGALANGYFRPATFAGEASEVPPELRQVVVKDATADVFDGPKKIGEAKWGETYYAFRQDGNWLWISSRAIAKKRFIKGWIKREAVLPEDASEELYLAAARERPDDPLPPFYLALRAIGNKEADRALELADRAIRLGPNDPLPHIARAEALTLKNDFEQARAECLAALKIDPASAAGHRCLADVFSEQKRPKEAIEELARARERDPFDPMIAQYLARLYWEQKDLVKAKKTVDEALRLDPLRGSTYHVRSVIDWASHDLEAAVKDIAAAVRLDPDSGPIRMTQSMCDEFAGDMRGAYREALAAFDNGAVNPDPRWRLITTLRRDEATTALTRLHYWATQPPLSPEKYRRVATAHEMCGNWDEALAMCRAALELDADNLPAILELAMILGIKGEHVRGIEALAASRRLQESKLQFLWPRRLFEPAATPSNDMPRQPAPADVQARFEQRATFRTLFVPVSINGKTVRMMLDTGSPFTAVNDDARDIMGPQSRIQNRLVLGSRDNPELLSVPFGQKMEGKASLTMSLQGGRKVSATLHHPGQFRIGPLPIDVDKMELACANDNSICTIAGTAGLVGLDALEKTILQFDPSSDMLCFLGRLPADPGVAIPLTESRKSGVHGPILNRVGVKLQFSEGSSELFWIDTGCWESIRLRSELYERLEAAGAIQSVESAADATASKAKATRLGCLNSLRLAQFEHHNVFCIEHATENILGLEYLTRFVATIDFPGKTLYLRPSCNHAKSEAELQAFYEQNVLYILFIGSARGLLK